jgi:hypothetical protein
MDLRSAGVGRIGPVPVRRVASPRRTGRLVTVLLVVSVALLVLTWTGAPAPAGAVTDRGTGWAMTDGVGAPPVHGSLAEVAQAPEPTTSSSVRTGPDPTGQPVPDRGQRIIDSAVWLWLLGCLAVAAVLVARTWWRAPGEAPLVDLDDDRSSADGAPPDGQ